MFLKGLPTLMALVKLANILAQIKLAVVFIGANLHQLISDM